MSRGFVCVWCGERVWCPATPDLDHGEHESPWRDEFLAGGIEGLKSRPLQPEDRRLKEAERKIGELTMDNEILRAAARKRGLQITPRKRPR